MIYYDITDLIRRAQESDHVTGIQRVLLEGLRGVGADAVPIFLSPHTRRWFALPGFRVGDMDTLEPFREMWERADLVAFPTQAVVDHYGVQMGVLPARTFRGKLKRRLRRLRWFRSRLTRATARALRPNAFADRAWPVMELLAPFTPDDQIVLFGAPWHAQNEYELLLASAPVGVTKTLLVYDLIPLNSAFVPDELREMFRSFIPFVVTSATHLIVTSESVADDLREFAYEHGLEPLPIKKVHLAHHLPAAATPQRDPSLRVRKLFVERYILCVGSLESRKNHINLLVLWSRLVNSTAYRGEKLVIAGGWLWDFSAIQNLLFETGHVNGTVIVIERPDDSELRHLYEHCRFTVYPSHYEGWGLPVGESLSFGKPCLHFDNSSLREAGFGISEAVPYHSLDWLYKSLVRLVEDDLYYERCTELIGRYQTRLRSWKDFSKDAAEAIRLSTVSSSTRGVTTWSQLEQDAAKCSPSA